MKTTSKQKSAFATTLGQRLLLLALLGASPLAAHADALDGAFLVFVGMAVLWGIALGEALFVVLAYRHPASGILRVFNIIFVLIGLGLGTFWARVFDSSASPFLSLNPFLDLALPLALWLGGVGQARAATRPAPRLVGVSGAALGAIILLSTLFFSLLRMTISPEILYGGSRLWFILLRLPLVFGSWWLVLRQVQQAQPLGWHRPAQWLLPPAMTAGLGLLLSLFTLWLSISSHNGSFGISFSSLFGSLLQSAVPAYGVGVLAIWLHQRRYAAEGLSAASGGTDGAG